jgi:hypothetical protein
MLCVEYFIKGTIGGGSGETSDSDLKISIRIASIYELKDGNICLLIKPIRFVIALHLL